MNLSPVSAIHSVYNMPEAQKPVPAAQKASPIEDTVTLSPAAQKAASGGDVDHDGDSH